MAEEIFDVVDENGQPTGETVTRSQAHAEGIRHRTAHIWVVRENGDKTEVLLQKRAMNKDSFPGRYDTSSAGHIQAGDEPLESAVRELSEELGIQADPDDLKFAGTFPIQYEKEFHGKPFKDNEIAFVYVYDEEVEIDNLTIQKEELDSVEWFDLEEVYQACQPPRDEKFCVPIGGLEIVRKYVKADEGDFFMKTLIIYYSHEGNTDFVAKKIADKIGADTLRLVPVKKYPEKGFAKFFWGGKSAVMAETPDLEPYSIDLASYEQIVFGFPVWASNITPPLRTFIKENPGIKEKRIAAFACQSGAGAEKAFGKLKESIGIDSLAATLILIDPKDKPSDDNDKKIEDFCKEIF